MTLPSCQLKPRKILTNTENEEGMVHIVKKAILHRKNAIFYKMKNGAKVGDMCMSLIHTCELCGVNPFDYLNDIQLYFQTSHSAKMCRF